ncbi:hypothetical protein SDC9_143456 [bioreactor metagenome]|uniref:Uncharacterized protein n=1 Tax=bioreactor metagenome TaxID=1076179 RepID=A0A645E4H8_9ZZZZ
MDFINSTSAMKVNSYCKGNGTLKRLKEEIESFGLSSQGEKALLDIVEGYGE